MRLKLVAVFVLIFPLLAKSGEFRVFTDTQGRAIEARILSFDPVKGEVEIERQDGKRVWLSPKLFSGDDQRYVKDWVAAYRVLSDDCLRISFDKVKVDSFKEGMTDEERVATASKGEIICYEITLSNRSKNPFEGLKVEYRYFIRVEEDKTDKTFLKNIPVGSSTIKRIEPGEKVTFRTRETRVETRYSKTEQTTWSSGFVGYALDQISDDKLLGIWLRIYGPPVEGEPAVRDVTDPESLQQEVGWND